MNSQVLKKISINEIEGFSIGNAELTDAGTGCTVILAEGGAVTGLDVRGGGPASRESALLNPLAANDSVNAVLLSGGSAYGLDAAAGVMKYPEERNTGFPTAYGVVPIVCASCLFDLPVGRADIRPDAALGYQACENAGHFEEGNHGAGTGASCGKAMGMEYAMKSGLGVYAVQVGELKVGAVVAANPFGTIYDHETGRPVAGIKDHDGNFIDSEDVLFAIAEKFNAFTDNTTIGAILTNGIFNKAELCKIAGMAHDGLARAIRPVHTMFDGDSVYAMSKGTVKADINVVGAIAAKVMAEAIKRAALKAESAYGLRGAGNE